MIILKSNQISDCQKEVLEFMDSNGLTIEMCFYPEHNNSIYYLEYIDDKLIACLIASQKDSTIEYLCVDKNYRRNGYGTKLISLLYESNKSISYNLLAVPGSHSFWNKMKSYIPTLNIDYLYE